MNDNEFDGLPDNEWDDTWELAWSEFDWEKYLREQDGVVETYLSAYERCLERSDRIDEVAHTMGWDEAEWTSDEADPGSGPSPAPATDAKPSDADEVPEGRMDPYTIQKHPVYVSTRALFVWLSRSWEFVAPACGPKLPLRTAMGFASALERSQHLSLLAIHSLDMGDYSLAVSQIKRALVDLNSAMRRLQSLSGDLHPAFAQFQPQALIRIFDIREIWLRVMRDCREELDRRVRGSEN